MHSYQRSTTHLTQLGVRDSFKLAIHNRWTIQLQKVHDRQLITAHATSTASKLVHPELAPAAQQKSFKHHFVTEEKIQLLEAELDSGTAVAALRLFNTRLQQLPEAEWESKLKPVMTELAYNLESFNPAFTAILLAVQSSIGYSDYERRDATLKDLIQPLAGEYGMHNGEAQAKTHRELFSDFYEDLFKEPLDRALTALPRPQRAVKLFEQMMRDLRGDVTDRSLMEQAAYALGYNLAIEYLADYEKTWMLDSFRHLNTKILRPQGRALSQWLFLEVHAEGEAEHAAIGHRAAATFTPASHFALLRQAMQDHNRDFAAFYNGLADMLT